MVGCKVCAPEEPTYFRDWAFVRHHFREPCSGVTGARLPSHMHSPNTNSFPSGNGKKRGSGGGAAQTRVRAREQGQDRRVPHPDPEGDPPGLASGSPGRRRGAGSAPGSRGCRGRGWRRAGGPRAAVSRRPSGRPGAAPCCRSRRRCSGSGGSCRGDGRGGRHNRPRGRVRSRCPRSSGRRGTGRLGGGGAGGAPVPLEDEVQVVREGHHGPAPRLRIREGIMEDHRRSPGMNLWGAGSPIRGFGRGEPPIS